jgi:hypothetical protein
LVITMNSKYTQVSLLEPPQNLDHRRSYWFEFTRSNPVTNQTCSRQLWTSSPKHNYRSQKYFYDKKHDR